mmetsp:Transcript_39064/g.117416  ORF Transcript_39064/g.117416 Transcript_39064/m.117416 type:complete len:233 (+) Transcript_39064:953-1651(+)
MSFPLDNCAVATMIVPVTFAHSECVRCVLQTCSHANKSTTAPTELPAPRTPLLRMLPTSAAMMAKHTNSMYHGAIRTTGSVAIVQWALLVATIACAHRACALQARVPARDWQMENLVKNHPTAPTGLPAPRTPLLRMLPTSAAMMAKHTNSMYHGAIRTTGSVAIVQWALLVAPTACAHLACALQAHVPARDWQMENLVKNHPTAPTGLPAPRTPLPRMPLASAARMAKRTN